MLHRLRRFIQRQPFARWFGAGFALILVPWGYAIVVDNIWNQMWSGQWQPPQSIVSAIHLQYEVICSRPFAAAVAFCILLGICTLAGTLVVFMAMRFGGRQSHPSHAKE